MTGISSSRRFSFAGVFAALGISLVIMAFRIESMIGSVILAWFAVDALTLSVAYCANWTRVFGKTDEGKLIWLPAFVMAPMLLLIRVLWHLQNLAVRTPLYNEILPDLFVGRLCPLKSLPKDVSLFVDLTAEFETPRSVRKNLRFVCIPTLDGCPPDWQRCLQAFKLLEDKGCVYVCCANGHGRSVTFVAAWLGRANLEHSATDAVTFIQERRPTAAPNRDQRSFLSQVFKSMTSDMRTDANKTH